MWIIIIFILDLLFLFMDIKFLNGFYISIYHIILFLEIYLYIGIKYFYLKGRRYFLIISGLIGIFCGELIARGNFTVGKGTISGMVWILGINLMIIMLLEYIDYRKEK
ncbi:hypothetical protein [Haliovirga abyssi]|uniref:Uncharacterized protein n=1 Tax=Haliovirga abyssi TaxID=2996794 RepID=A0AAU9D8R6_9FUSO|nr:hypothetical protein [Haliovirga abyssi]BDU51003.1 hypothetical protein HLVA_15720 [Haliovirga abyssi]